MSTIEARIKEVKDDVNDAELAALGAFLIESFPEQHIWPHAILYNTIIAVHPPLSETEEALVTAIRKYPNPVQCSRLQDDWTTEALLKPIPTENYSSEMITFFNALFGKLKEQGCIAVVVSTGLGQTQLVFTNPDKAGYYRIQTFVDRLGRRSNDYLPLVCE